MKIVDAMTLRKNFGALIDEVFYKNESVTIERRGKKRAMIVPIESVGLYEVNEELLSDAHKSLIKSVSKMKKSELLSI